MFRFTSIDASCGPKKIKTAYFTCMCASIWWYVCVCVCHWYTVIKDRRHHRIRCWNWTSWGKLLPHRNAPRTTGVERLFCVEQHPDQDPQCWFRGRNAGIRGYIYKKKEMKMKKWFLPITLWNKFKIKKRKAPHIFSREVHDPKSHPDGMSDFSISALPTALDEFSIQCRWHGPPWNRVAFPQICTIFDFLDNKLGR